MVHGSGLLPTAESHGRPSNCGNRAAVAVSDSSGEDPGCATLGLWRQRRLNQGSAGRQLLFVLDRKCTRRQLVGVFFGQQLHILWESTSHKQPSALLDSAINSTSTAITHGYPHSTDSSTNNVCDQASTRSFVLHGPPPLRPPQACIT